MDAPNTNVLTTATRISKRVIDVEVLSNGSPIVKIPRICFEVQVGSRGITFHRYQFPVRLCYAMTISKSQGQTLQRVGLDLRGEVFAHGQLYVAISRTTCNANILCLVNKNRLIDGVPHVHNVVYKDFIIAATGHPPPVFTIKLSHGDTNGGGSGSGDNDDRGNDTNSNSGDNDNSNNGDNALPPPPGSWEVINEIGDGACLLRCIARRVLNNANMHTIVRSQILQHISDHLHDPIPGSGGLTMHTAISAGINSEHLRTAGCPDQTYSSVQHYLQLMAHPYAYATYVESTAAEQLYNINIRVTHAGQPFPNPPSPNTCDVIYSHEHYCTLRYNSPSVPLASPPGVQ